MYKYTCKWFGGCSCLFLLTLRVLQVGLAIKPGTTVEELAPWANQINMALVMTVEPGFGGQKFKEDMMPKVMTNPRGQKWEQYTSVSTLGFKSCHTENCQPFDATVTIEHNKLLFVIMILYGPPVIWRHSEIDSQPEWNACSLLIRYWAAVIAKRRAKANLSSQWQYPAFP